MAEIRWNPMTEDWVMIASHRQDRPQMPRDWCPFCPGSGRVPDDYDVLCYDNDFPALSATPPEPDAVATELFAVAPAYGKCEVILYSPEHRRTVPELGDAHMVKLMDLWRERFAALRQDPLVRYVFIFENRGDAVGVTMPHPHGQIYAYPFLPKKMELELGAQSRSRRETGDCLFCRILKEELEDGRRIIDENEHFVLYLPFWSEYPYGVQIMARRHVGSLCELTEGEAASLAILIRDAAGMLDALFHMRFPYMMCMHNAPVNQSPAAWPDLKVHSGQPDFHFHIEFFPPMRSADKIKYNASSETGVWAHCNTTAPEEVAVELRAALARFRAEGPRYRDKTT